jgi:hypothetical protein
VIVWIEIVFPEFEVVDEIEEFVFGKYEIDVEFIVDLFEFDFDDFVLVDEFVFFVLVRESVFFDVEFLEMVEVLFC